MDSPCASLCYHCSVTDVTRAPPYTLVESKIANFAHYRRVNGQETDAYSSSWKLRRTLYSLLVQTAIDPQILAIELFTDSVLRHMRTIIADCVHSI